MTAIIITKIKHPRSSIPSPSPLPCSLPPRPIPSTPSDTQQRYTQKVDFAALKSEIQLHEKNDLTLMKAENERLMADVEKLKQRLREEVTRVQAGVRLDLNLEKGRIRDESSQQELKIKEVDTRIESEIAGLRTQIEQAKFSILQYLVGVATGSGALLLAYMRMMVSGLIRGREKSGRGRLKCRADECRDDAAFSGIHQ